MRNRGRVALIVGQCPNVGHCSKADARTPLPMPAGEWGGVCPECGTRLVPTARPARVRGGCGRSLLVLLVLIAGLAVAVWQLAGKNTAAPGPARSAIPPSGRAVQHGPAAAFRLCGSNTIGSELGPALVRAYLAQRGTASLPFSIDDRGSATAFTGLAAGTCDVGMSSRPIDPAEVARLRPLGDMRSRASEHVIGLDGIAVIVNPANPVRRLRIDQLREIFAGRLSWDQVGGAPGQIVVYARDANSGTYEAFKTLVLRGAPLAPSARRFEDSGTLADRVAADPNGIGFIGLPYVRGAQALQIASGSAQALAPTALTVARETYPLTRRLFLYIPQRASELARGFVRFAESAAGQRLVNEAGFVGNVAAVIPTPPPASSLGDAPAEYLRIARSSDQTTFNFYFRPGSDELDNKGYVDVGRLTGQLAQPEFRSRGVILAGFADSTGAAAANVVLSERRARAVARELRAQGVNVIQTAGFGAALPIRDNATPEGREKNRRVEVFVAR